MRFFLFALLFTIGGAAKAAPVVLMVNLNYSSAELKAAEDVARARKDQTYPGGQRVEMVPPKTMIPLVERLFAERDRVQALLEAQFPDINPLTLKSAVAGVMRSGSRWQGDPRITQFLGDDQMNGLYSRALEVSNAEKQYGDVYSQLERKSAELEQRGDWVDSVIISSHSDGSNLFGETSLHISSADLAQIKQEHGNLFNDARHVLLLGCYNMTKPNHEVWRNDLYPNASMLAGFGLKAPSRNDSTSPNFIRQTMARAQQLDEYLAATGNPIDPGTLQQAFKTLGTFTTQAHPGVVDYCYSLVEGQPGTWTHDCDTQWKDLYTKKNMMRDYWSLVSPREDPPSVSGGELRAFYNLLQSACPASQANSERADWQASERMRVSLRENVIRLIFWWNVQHNFATFSAKEIRSMDGRLAAAGVSTPMPRLDGTVSRVTFVKSYRATLAQLRENDPLTARAFQKLYGPLYLLQGEDSVSNGEKLSVEETLARGAIPFNWIETTVLRGHE